MRDRADDLMGLAVLASLMPPAHIPLSEGTGQITFSGYPELTSQPEPEGSAQGTAPRMTQDGLSVGDLPVTMVEELDNGEVTLEVGGKQFVAEG